MKHKSVAISFSDLFNRIESDTDTPATDVMGIEPDEGYENEEFIGDPVASYGESMFGPKTYLEIKDKWFSVSWPEHVTTPRYNSDAFISGPCSREEAIEDADLIYGE